jgi:rhodanese-related sulfurtransferase
MEDIQHEAVQKLVAAGAQLIEVLPHRQYQQEHIAGAINIPLGRLEEEAGRLDRDRAVIVYYHDYQ